MGRKFFGALLTVCLLAGGALAEGLQSGFLNPYVTSGVRISPQTITPTMRKWYLPQTLYDIYGWKNWEYTNYARDRYERYTDIVLQGQRFYDIYGNYITRGWKIYEWAQQHPTETGSAIDKSVEFNNWFNNLVISTASQGQYHMALTVGEQLRTTLTPMTFSKPLFNGVQWDFLSDKYALTLIASRTDNPALAATATNRNQGATVRTLFTNLVGLRGTAQVGDFIKLGTTYVNAGHWNSSESFGNNSLKGTLGSNLQAGNVQRLLVRLSDDSPEDGEGGALLFLHRVYINGVEHPEISDRALVDGGIRRQGRWEASGGNNIIITYDIERDFTPIPDEDEIIDFKEIKKIEIELVLANDYAVEVTSNMQVNNTGEPVFLPVTRAEKNIKDGSNQRVVRFSYGLPTANEVAGLTMEIDDLFGGFNLRAEYNINRKYRRFPNQNFTYNQALGKERAEGYYVTASHNVYPWFAYGEIFSMDPGYQTFMFVPDSNGRINYESAVNNVYEFVDDNDDQDRFPDWRRRTFSSSSSERLLIQRADVAVFPGYDENNDLVSDFNQNDNSMPDYLEPFVRYDVDPLEFLYGTDMNNNTVIDRFENDEEADYPYPRDHRGYNLYGGAEIKPGSRIMVGRMREWLLSSNRRNQSLYGLLTLTHEVPRHGLQVQLYNGIRSVKDNIPEDIILWVQSPRTQGDMRPFADPMIAQDALINTSFLSARTRKYAPLNLETTLKYEIYHQRGDQQPANWQDEKLLALITKADLPIPVGKHVLWPRWKQLYKRRSPTDKNELENNELAEIFFFVWQQELISTMRLESGIEYEIFRNMVERTDPLPAGYVDDFEQFVIAAQLSNRSDYLGYRLMTNIGGRWERRDFRDETTTDLVLFLSMFAGLQ